YVSFTLLFKESINVLYVSTKSLILSNTSSVLLDTDKRTGGATCNGGSPSTASSFGSVVNVCFNWNVIPSIWKLLEGRSVSSPFMMNLAFLPSCPVLLLNPRL